MAEHTTIEWSDATWQIVTGCSVVTPGCTSCYAMRLAGTRLQHHPSRAGLTRETKAGPVWTGEVRFNEQWLLQPLQWRRPRKIFVAAHGDLFHEAVPDAVLDRVFAVMALADWHEFQVLTKRSSRARAYLGDAGVAQRVAEEALRIWREPPTARQPRGSGFLSLSHQSDSGALHGPTLRWPLPNIWLGVSTEDQCRADERVPDLLATPAAVRFVSAEPLLGPIDFCHLQPGDPPVEIDALNGTHGVLRPHRGRSARLDWLIVGGESGPGARPMHPQWARDIRDACAAAGVAFHFKQHGAWIESFGQSAAAPVTWLDGLMMSRVGKKAAGRLLDGVEHNGMPEARHVG